MQGELELHISAAIHGLFTKSPKLLAGSNRNYDQLIACLADPYQLSACLRGTYWISS